MGADLGAEHAAHTLHLGVKELRGALLGFGVCTPGTTQRTTLEEDVRPDAGSIMGGKALDIKNHPLEKADPPEYV
mgnify:CR=1 FL=1